MAKIKAFKGYRPKPELASKMACRPYDVINSDEATQEAVGNQYSLYHITRAEIDFPKGVDEHSQEVYDKAVSNFDKFIKEGWLFQDESPKLYVYAQTMNGKTQYGVVAGASVKDYLTGIIKKHELTRPDKEEDRMKHIRETNANIEPVFLSYPAVSEIDAIVADIVEDEPIYHFALEDNVEHKFWVIDNAETIANLENLFETKVPNTYIADGHHRTAAAALVGKELKDKNPNHTGNEEYNYFLAVHFPDNQLNIIDYNRVVKDLNGLTKVEFIEKVSADFEVQKAGACQHKPHALHEFSFYIDGDWYKMTAKTGRYDDGDPIGVLDVTILSKLILDKILDIKDLRTDKRIDFVGGIRGLGELEKRVDNGEMKIAFALYPVSMQQLINISDSGNIMPPKTTWFEPKLRSGLVIHALS
ncbi:MAG: DUF1015 domain-containing protein [Bacteroidales bacterium]